MREQQKHMDIFEIYFAMGHTRSLLKLLDGWAELVPYWAGKPPSLNTLKNWSKWFDWQERIMLREKEIAKGTERKLIREEINTRAESIKTIRKALGALKSNLATAFIKLPNGKIVPRDEVKIKDAKELNATVAAIFRGEEVLQKLIEPEETVRHEVGGAIKITEVKIREQERTD